MLEALCKTPPVSASDFNSTYLTLRPRKTYIYVFPASLFLFLSHFMFFGEARNKSISFYTKFLLEQLYFWRLNVLVSCCTANQYSKITSLFSLVYWNCYTNIGYIYSIKITITTITTTTATWARAVNTDTNWRDKVGVCKLRPRTGNKIVDNGR